MALIELKNHREAYELALQNEQKRRVKNNGKNNI